MREIKFRQWMGNRFSYWGFLDKPKCFASPSSSNQFGGLSGLNTTHQQFTGLQDSKGVDIYEGDVVQFTYWWFDGNEAESELTGTIIYDSGCMSFAMEGIKNKEWLRHVGGDDDTTAFAFFNFDEADFTVIGNIYEDKDLIK